jgi:hypothetical protein
MKILTTFFAAIGILFLTSCSDINQDSSPVSPYSDVLEKSPLDQNFSYQYLQSFSSVAVSDYYTSKSAGIIMELETAKSPQSLKHVYALLDYGTQLDPPTCYLVYLGNQQSSTVEIPDYSIANLKGVRLYSLPKSDVPIIRRIYISSAI